MTDVGETEQARISCVLIANQNRSVIIQVITKSDFITNMIKDRIGRHEVLLPIQVTNS